MLLGPVIGMHKQFGFGSYVYEIQASGTESISMQARELNDFENFSTHLDQNNSGG